MYGVSLECESYPFNTPLTILNDSILNNGGSLTSNTTLTVMGYNVSVNLTRGFIFLEFQGPRTIG